MGVSEVLLFQNINSIIQLIIAPVVLITSCSIFLNGLLTRYAAVNDRMRLLARERLKLGFAIHPDTPPSPLTVERLHQICYQLPQLLRRHNLLRDSVLIGYLAVLIFVADMFVIALAVFSSLDWIGGMVLIIFLIGVAMLFISTLLTLIEVWHSHRAVSYEIERVIGLENLGAPS